MTGFVVGALHMAGDAANRTTPAYGRERASVRLPAVRGLRAESHGVHAEALRRLATRVDVTHGQEPGRRVHVDARLVAVAIPEPSSEPGPGVAAGRPAPPTAEPTAPPIGEPTAAPAAGPAADRPVPRFDVLVEVGGAVVGRLPEGHAPLWHAPLSRAQEAGVEVTCGAVLTLPGAGGSVSRGGSGVSAGASSSGRSAGSVSSGGAAVLSLRVCEPEHLRLMLTTPDWALPLVPECSVTLSGARVSSDLIARVTRRMVDWVTLHPVTIESGRHAGEPGVEVRLEGQRIGEFSAAVGARYRPVVDAAAEVSKTPLARARLRDDERGIELDVLLPRPA